MSFRLITPRVVSRSRASLLPRFTISSDTTTQRFASFNLGPTASPPRLPEEEQKIFEELQRRSTGAFMQQPSSSDSSQTSSSSSFASSSTTTTASSSSTDAIQAQQQQQEQPETPVVRVQATGNGDELHPHMRRGAPPEFQGDVNPKTGEVGGPKNEPLRWGGTGDWSYNGRTTDF